MSRSLRTLLDLLRSDLGSVVARKTDAAKVPYDDLTSLRQFVVRQRVLVRNFRQGPKWVQATIVNLEVWLNIIHGTV